MPGPARYGVIELEPQMLAEMRALRLFHFKKASMLSGMARRCPDNKSLHDEATVHIRFIITMNNFFDYGDTADKDAKNEPRNLQVPS